MSEGEREGVRKRIIDGELKLSVVGEGDRQIVIYRQEID